MDFDASAQVDALAKLPPEPPKPPPGRWNGWSAPLRGLAAGAAEVGAFAADAAKGYGQIMSAGGTERAGGMFSSQTEEERRESELQRFKLSTDGVDTTSEVGTALRDVSRDYRPDPATAGLAERLAFDLTRFLGKAVGYSVLGAGVPGAVALGADEAMTVSDDLMRQGVDKDTRMQAGTVAGVAAAAGVVLPVAAAGSIPKTIGLWALGGPGAFIAQQAATREILADADYAELSTQYDPLDPVGLLVSSLVPAGFAAWAVRGARVKPVAPITPARPALTPEQVDAVMTHNLTLARDVHEASTPPAARMPDATRDIFAEQLDGLYAERAELLSVAGDLAGRGEIRDARQEVSTLKSRPPPSGPEAVQALAKQLQRSEGVSYKAARGMAEKRIGDAVSDHEAKLARLNDFIERNAAAQQAVGRIAKLDESIALMESAAPPRPADATAPLPEALPAEAIPPRPATEVDAFATRMAASDDAAVRNVGEGIRRAADVLGPEQMAAITRAADTYMQAREAGTPIAKAVEDLNLPPEVTNLVAGIVENAHSAPRIEALAREVMKTVEDFKTTSAGVTADAVERLRTLTDEQITGAQAKVAKSSDVEPMLASMQERIARIEALAPDMAVRTDEAGQPVTVAKEMARIREEARKGTDMELGADDADLVSVAANCTLSVGA